jgi:hypothetical protein
MSTPPPILKLVRTCAETNAALHQKLRAALQRLAPEVAAVEQSDAPDYFDLDALLARLTDAVALTAAAWDAACPASFVTSPSCTTSAEVTDFTAERKTALSEFSGDDSQSVPRPAGSAVMDAQPKTAAEQLADAIGYALVCRRFAVDQMTSTEYAERLEEGVRAMVAMHPEAADLVAAAEVKSTIIAIGAA